MKPLALAIGLFGAVTLSNVCNAQIFDDPFAEYVERGVTINPSAGNANEANAAIQTIDPWPPYVGHTRIPGNGRETVNAMEKMYILPYPLAPLVPIPQPPQPPPAPTTERPY
jgi:hypothetical protein